MARSILLKDEQAQLMRNQPSPPTPEARNSPVFAGPTDIYQNVRAWLSIAARGPLLQMATPGFLVTGPPGCGKATVVHAAAAEHGVPVVELDPLDYLPALGGAVPRRIEDAVSEFCSHLEFMATDRWYGIILMRGIDRLARAGEVGSLLQANLASLMRRTSCRTYFHGQMVEVNPATQISFVLTSSLPEFSPARDLGFHDLGHAVAVTANPSQAPDDDALHSYGFSRTLLDACKLKFHLPTHDHQTLRDVMRGSGFVARAIRFSEDCLRIRLDFTECALHEMAAHALRLGRNAHSLESVVYGVIEHVNVEREKAAPNSEVRVKVDRGTVQGGSLAGITPCKLPPAPPIGPAGSPTKSPGVTFRRCGRGAGSSSETRIANARDLARWMR